jgi:heme/copper-type cytochrome/quinol oxidase subunit 2
LNLLQRIAGAVLGVVLFVAAFIFVSVIFAIVVGIALGVCAWIAWKMRKLRRAPGKADGSVIEGEYRVEREATRLDEPRR